MDFLYKSLYQLLLLAMLVLIGLLSGCSTYYGIANWADPGYVYEKPAYRGENRDTLYVTSRSSVYLKSFGESPSLRGYEQLLHYSLGAYRSYSRKGYSFSYGSFSHLGNYTTEPILDIPRQQLPFFGSGGSLEATSSITLGPLIIRPIGVKATFLGEFGPYARFRKYVEANYTNNGYSNDIIVLTRSNFSASIGLTQEFMLSFPKFEISASSFLGRSESDVFMTSINRIRIQNWSFDMGFYYSSQGVYPNFGLSKRF